MCDGNGDNGNQRSKAIELILACGMLLMGSIAVGIWMKCEGRL